MFKMPKIPKIPKIPKAPRVKMSHAPKVRKDRGFHRGPRNVKFY